MAHLIKAQAGVVVVDAGDASAATRILALNLAETRAYGLGCRVPRLLMQSRRPLQAGAVQESNRRRRLSPIRSEPRPRR